MKITVNGEPINVSSDNLAALLAELEFEQELVATAVNQSFVRAKDRAATVLQAGDQVEILTPRQGG
jgi:sulfur carrier protein